MLIRLKTSRPLMCCLLIVILTSPIASAQNPGSTAADRTRIERERQRTERDYERRVSDLRNLRKDEPRKGPSEPPSVKLSAEQKKLLEPSAAQRAAFAAFLRQPETGLVRLLPREKFDGTVLMPLRGGGAFYSFTKLSHAASPFSDIMFQSGRFRVALSGLTYALMTMQGETPLEQLTADHPAVKYLRDLVPPLDYQDLRIETDKIWEGFEVGGSLYKTILPAQLNSTYLLRSTIHGGPDTVVAFRVVGWDADGSVTLLWKRLYNLKSKKFKDIPEDR
jgi:hypothetical protein